MEVRLKYPKRKIEMFRRAEKLLKNYHVVAIAEYEGFTSNYFKKIRQVLKERAVIYVVKNKVFTVVLKKLMPSIYESIKWALKGKNAFIFTNLHPTKLYSLLLKNPQSMKAKPGDLATFNIYIPEGPTDLSPGPIMSKFGELGIKTKVQSGKIYISKEKLLVKKGEVIDKKSAEILSMLGIKPVKAVFNLKIAFDDKGTVYLPESITLTPKKAVKAMKKAFSESVSLALSLSIINRYTAPYIINMAYLKCLKLASETNIPTRAALPIIIRRVYSKAQFIGTYLKQKVGFN